VTPGTDAAATYITVRPSRASVMELGKFTATGWKKIPRLATTRHSFDANCSRGVHHSSRASNSSAVLLLPAVRRSTTISPRMELWRMTN